MSKLARLVMALGPCPLWLSSILLAFQALTELEGTDR